MTWVSASEAFSSAGSVAVSSTETSASVASFGVSEQENEKMLMNSALANTTLFMVFKFVWLKIEANIKLSAVM